MKFSIIIPSYLGPYAGASTLRDQKIVRAINSCLGQTFEDFEVLVIADGCQQTVDICSTIKDERLRVFHISKAPLFSGEPRNKGLDEAKGEFIVYLDIDDIYGRKHLQVINEGLNGFDWVWYNDIRYNVHQDIWYENQCNIKQVGQHGTSNICHRASLPVRWEFKGYAHDYYFVQKLLEFKNFTKITSPEYYVCHVPGTKTSGGYDC